MLLGEMEEIVIDFKKEPRPAAAAPIHDTFRQFHVLDGDTLHKNQVGFGRGEALGGCNGKSDGIR